MKKHPGLLFLLLPALLFNACSHGDKTPEFTSFRGTVFGTYYTISYYADDARDLMPAIDSLFGVFNQSLSYYEKNSLISRINRNETDSVDDLFRLVFERSKQIAAETDGAFDATVSPLVNAWGFGFSKRSDITPELIDSLLQFTGYQKARLEGNRLVKEDQRIQFDFNAIAKGYAADVVGQFLESKGINIYLVEIGGDLVVKGVKPGGNKWRIGLENPAQDIFSEQQWDYYVEIEDIGLATSGNYRRYYEIDGQRYAHTIDPKSGYPTRHSLLSASVFAPDGMSADAYATAFMVMGLEKAIEFVEARDDLEAFFIYTVDHETYNTHATSGLKLFKR